MAIDLNKLTMSMLRRELEQQGLETTGKKSELVERLKTSLEDADEKAENGEEKTENGEEKTENGEEKTENGEEKTENEEESKPKKWFHVMTSRMLEKPSRSHTAAANMYKNLEVVQKMSQLRKKRDFTNASVGHRVRAFPVRLEDLGDPVIADIARRSSQTNVTILPGMGEDQELYGMIKFALKKKSDMTEVAAALLTFKTDLKVHYQDCEEKYTDYQAKWFEITNGTTVNPDKQLMLCPLIPEGVGEDDMWRMFPSARELYIFEAKKALVKVAGKKEVEKEQPSYAYVQFPSVEASTKDIEALADVVPTDEMRKMRFIPFVTLAEDNLQAAKKEQAQTAATKTAINTPGPAYKPGGVSTNSKSVRGRSGWPQGKNPNNAPFRGRGGPMRGRGGFGRGGWDGPGSPNMGRGNPNMGRGGRGGYQGGPPQGQRPYSAPFRDLRAEAARRGPEEARGLNMMLGQVMSDGYQEDRWEDPREEWIEPAYGPPKRSYPGGGPVMGGGMEKRRRPMDYSDDYGGYEDSYNDSFGPPSGRGGGRGRGRGRGRGSFGSARFEDDGYGGSGYGGY